MSVTDNIIEKLKNIDSADLFQPTPTVVENTKPYKPGEGISSESIHNTLMAAGFAPGIGNIADATDALLYAFEGEFGNAALSSAAAVPIVGQYISSQKLLKAAKESGEEMITLYRGVPGWFPGRMVKDGKFISPKHIEHEGIRVGEYETLGTFVSPSKEYAKTYTKGSHKYDMKTGKKLEKMILKFHVPKSWYDKARKNILDIDEKLYGKGSDVFIEGGIPKDFLIKAEKIDG
tara:strand:+ start:855 stop:1553 length:699 start_codon:yes stop_codon:yes gene_type:complete